MLQVFHTDVAKVDRDVAYVVMVVLVCCKSVSPMFHLFFSDIYCKNAYLDVAYIFTHMLKVFYLDVVYVCNGFQVFISVFVSVSSTCFKCFICLFFMLQVLHLNISKVDRVLHMGCAWEAGGGARRG
jgi:hypothetical protein